MKKILAALIFNLSFLFSIAQPITVLNITPTGKLLECPGSAPVVTITKIGGAGSTVNGGVLTNINQCDSTRISISISNMKWNQGPDVNWIHGVFFPAGGFTGYTYVTGSTTLSPLNWVYTPGGCSRQCANNTAPIIPPGNAGFYYGGTTSNSCCPSPSPATPCDNWGDGSFTCTNPFSLTFELSLCNDKLTGAFQTLRLNVTSDGNTGCWSIKDPSLNTLTFQYSTAPAPTPLFSPAPISSIAATKTCSPSLNYTATFTGGCGNGNMIQWYDAPVGGNLIGTGSPFVYDPAGSACPGGTTLYASCCLSANTCAARKAVTVQPCPAPLIIDSIYHTDPTCTNAAASIDSVHYSNADIGAVTYTLNPGNITNSTGVFPGLVDGVTYTVTVTDAGGCTATKNITFVAPTNCCGPAPIPQGPVTYCQNATGAIPLTATGTALLWYTTATGGTGSATAPTPSTATAGTFTYYVSQTVSGCESPRAAIVVTIMPLATITLTSAPTTNNQTVCVNLPIVNITYATANGVTGAVVTGLPSGVTGAFNAGTGVVTLSGTPTVIGTFNYTVTTSGGCTPPTATGVIIVNPAATIVLSSAAATTNQTVCINTPITNITYTVAGGATGATATGLPAGVAGNYGGGVFTISGTPSVSGTFNYTISTTGGCGVATAIGSIIVTPNVTLTLSSAAATTSQTVCANTPIVNITYTTGSGATGATVTGLPTGVTFAYAGSTLSISGSPTVTGTFPYTVTTTGGCGSATLSGTITVTPGAATLTLSSAPATTTQSVCINTAITNITYTTGGGATGGSVTGLPAGVTGTYSAGTITISGTPTVSGVFNYTASTTGSGSCGSPTQTGTITVNDNATITLTSAAPTTTQSVCINTAIVNITYSTANGVTGASVSGLPAGVASSFTGGVFTISGTPTATGVFPYTVTTTGGCATATATGTITVNALSTLTLSSAASTTTQSLCINTALVNITYTTGGGATGATVTGLPAGVSGVYSAGTFTISGTPTVSGPFSYTVSTTGGCGVATLTGTITVNPNMTIVLTSAAATTSQTVCANIAINNIVYTTANGATSATATGLPTGVTGSYSAGVFTISGSPTVPGTYSYIVTASGGCGVASLTGSITVTPGAATLTLTSAPTTANQTVCINTAINNITYVTGGGASGGTVTGLPAGVNGVFSAGTITISGTPTVAGVFNYTVTTTGSGSCGSPSQAGVITVNSNATIALSSAAGTDAQTVCINTAITNITYTTTNGVTGASATGLPAGVTGNFAGGIFTISGTPTAAGTFPYTITTSGGCTVTTATGTITVNPLSTIALTSAPGSNNQTVSINVAISTITYSGGNGTTNITVTGLPAGITGNYAAGVFTISGSTSLVGTFPYTVTTSGGCGVATLTGTIIVNDLVTLTLTSGAGTNNQTICTTAAIVNIIYAAGGGATGASITAGALPAGVTGTYNAGNFTIAGTPTVTGTFNYTVSTSGGVGVASLSGTIIILPNATIALTSAAATTAQTLCINTAIANITYSVANGGTGATVTGLPAGITGSFAGGVFTISGTPTASGSFPYTVTTTGGCSTASLSGTITVNPNATITLTSAAGTDAQSICTNTAITNIVYTTANGATGVTVTGLPAGVTGNFAGGVYTLSGTPTVTGSFPYTVTTTGGCSTATLSGTITVNANVTIALTSAAATTSQNLCINTVLTNITYSTTNGATGAAATGLPAGVTGNFAGGIFTISGTPTVSGSFPYTVTTSGGCSTASLSGTITVNPAATINLTSAAATTTQTVCINTAITNITYATATGATGATVTGLPAGVTGNFAGGIFTISGTPTLAGVFPYTVTTTGGCGTASLSGSITVGANVTLALSSAAGTDAQTACINTPINNITYTTTNGATGATVTGLPAGITGNFAGGVFTISGSATVTGSFPYTVTTTGGCSSATLSGTITINPNATIALTSATATTAQTLCENNAITNINYAVANGGTGATATGLPAGVAGNFAGGIFTISGTPTLSGIFSYTVNTTGGCSSANLSGTISVIAYPTKPVVKSPVLYCPNDVPRPLADSVTGTNLLWYTTATGGVGSSTSPTPSTTTPGTTNYYVSQSNGNCEGPRELIVVDVNNPLSINIGPDSTICEGNVVKYFPTVTPSGGTYVWRAVGVPNSTIDSINNLNATFSPVNNAVYFLKATLGGCSTEKSVNVNVRWKPIVDAGNNVAICLNSSTVLSGVITHTTPGPTGVPISDFVWTPNDSLSFDSALVVTAFPTKTTWYRLTVKTDSLNYGCAFTSYDSVKVVIQPTVIAFAGKDTLAVKGGQHQLQGSGGTFYEWSSPSATILNPTLKNPFVVLNNDANFYLKVSDAIGCFGYDSVFVKVYDGPKYYVPNAFSPNGDGLNDIFRAVPVGISNTTYFRVFNRFGELMFETNQWLKGWDGTYKGKPQPAGAYVWSVKGTDKDKKTVELQGSVMLVR